MAGARQERAIGLRAGVVSGLIWGVLVTASETLTQPPLDLVPADFISFSLRIGLHYGAAGIVLSLLLIVIARRFHGRALAPAIGIALLAATFTTLSVERLTVWYVPLFRKETMLGTISENYPDLAAYLVWNLMVYGGIYACALILFLRSAAQRGRVRLVERARLKSEALLGQVMAEWRGDLLQPDLLVESTAELGRRYAEGSDRGDKLLDCQVRFLRLAMSRVPLRTSDLASEIQLARENAALCRELARPACRFRLDPGIDGTAIAFPPLVLMRILDELSRATSKGGDLILRMTAHDDAIVLVVEGDAAARRCLSETTESHARISLRAVASEAASIRWTDAGESRLEITVPAANARSHPLSALEVMS